MVDMVRSRTDMTIVQEKITNKYKGERLPQLPHHHPLSAQHGAGAEGGFRGNSDSHKRNEFLGNGGAFPAV